MYMIITDLFDIDIHIFTVIKFLFNLGVRFKYICMTSIYDSTGANQSFSDRFNIPPCPNDTATSNIDKSTIWQFHTVTMELSVSTA